MDIFRELGLIIKINKKNTSVLITVVQNEKENRTKSFYVQGSVKTSRI